MRTFLLIVLFMVTGGQSPMAAQASLARPATAIVAQDLTPGEIELAAQSVEQRNNRAYWHVFMAFAAAWLLLLLYTVTIGRRFGKLEDDVRQLRRS